ncbi:hypothetical protein PTKIN_Ptkin06aG0126700 [Pterospermum kingtungense]
MEVDNANKRRKQNAERTKTYHQWTKEEDATLVECLRVSVEDRKWKADNRTFRTGYLIQLEKMMETRLPQSKLKAEPHIESRVKTLKSQYNAIAEMLALGSGFGWDDVEKCLTASKDVFDDWSHPNAKGLRNKAFPHYDNCAAIFRRDRATRLGVETAADAVEEIGDSVDDDSAGANKGTETPIVGTMEEVDGLTGATSRKTGAHKRARSSDGTDELVE